MTKLLTPPPARQPDLMIRPYGDQGQYVVKHRLTGDFFHLGETEHFLLSQLDGQTETKAIRTKFEQRFGEPLSEEELQEFVAMAAEQGLLTPNAAPPKGEGSQIPLTPGPSPTGGEGSSVTPLPAKNRQSILYWRQSLFDPDRLFTWLEPKIRFFWTRGFLIFSACSIVAATAVLAANYQALAETLVYSLRWETLLLVWLVLFVVTTLHEFAHGLTCKHFGGEVREIGFLLMFFMPCFYCNVSDAWLFREKSKRLGVTLAGGYFELFLWALAVFVWRITLPGSMPHYLAFLVVTGSGVKTLFNFNPLLKLDGYYLLSDWTETPNLRQRGTDYLMQHLRWRLWGAARPEPEARGRFLLAYGLAAWVYSLVFLGLMFVGMLHFVGQYLGPWGFPVMLLLGLYVGRGILGDVFKGEFRTMIHQRHKRTLFWLATLGAVGAASMHIPWPDQAGGAFEVRAQRRAELRAPVAGFLDAVYAEEGESISAGSVVVRLAIPDLASRTAQKEAELREAEARLKLLRAGSRPAEIAQQRQRVAAILAWCDSAREDRTRQQQVLEQDLTRLDKTLLEYKAVCDFTQQVLAKHEQLRKSNAVSEELLLGVRKNHVVACAQYEKTVAERGARAALGTQLAESQLAESEKEQALERAHLALLEAETRPEEIEAAEATTARSQEELRFLHQQASRLALASPISGALTTAWLKEKIGHHFAEGDLICEVEDPESLEVVIAIDEYDAAPLRPGQRVRLKARALPLEVLEVDVVRIAPKAVQGDAQSTVNVYCELDDSRCALRAGMTGYARVQHDRGSLAEILARRCLGLIRAEFWW